MANGYTSSGCPPGTTSSERLDFRRMRLRLSHLGLCDSLYNWGVDEPYDKGDGFGHIALGVDDVETACEKVREFGAEVTREPGPMKHGSTVLAFIEDPDGYQIELIEEGTRD